MKFGLDALLPLSLAAVDIAAGAVLYLHVSSALGLLLAVFGVLVLSTLAYRTVSHGTDVLHRSLQRV